MYNAMPWKWQEWFKGWMESIGLKYDRITYCEYSPEAGVLWVQCLKLHPVTEAPYVDPKNKDEPASDHFMYFFDKKPARINLYEWEKMLEKIDGAPEAS